MFRHRVVVIILLLLGLAAPVAAADEIELLASDGPAVFGAASGFLTLPSGRTVFVLTAGATAVGVLSQGVHVFDLDSRTWSEAEVQGADAPEVVWPSHVVVDDALLVFGGRTVNELIPLETFSRITIEEDNGEYVATVTTALAEGEVPSPRYAASAVVVSSVSTTKADGPATVAMSGGVTGAGVSLDRHILTLSTERNYYDFASVMPEARAGHASVAVGDGIQDSFGINSTGEITDNVFGYDIPSGSSFEIATEGDVPGARGGTQVTALNNAVVTYSCGIQSDGRASNQVHYGFPITRDRLWFYQGSTLPSRVVDHAAARVPSGERRGSNEEILIHGGEDGGVASGRSYLYTTNVPADVDAVVPAVASVSGAGAVFTSKGWFFNPNTSNIGIRFNIVPRVGSPGGSEVIELEFEPKEMTVIEDIISQFPGDIPVGALSISREDRTSIPLLGNTVISARQDTGDEYGQSFPIVSWGGDMIPPGMTAYATTTEDPAHYRVNVGGAALGHTEVLVGPERPIGQELAPPMRFTLDDGESFQINNVYDTFGLDPNQADAIIALTVESGALAAYGSALDGNGAYTGTSDPTTVTPSVPPGEQEVYLLELGSISGQGGSEFRGSASILNFGMDPAEVQVDFFARGASGVAASTNVTIPGGSAVGYSDFTNDVLGVSGTVGTVRFTTDGAGIAVIGREYSIRFDNQGNRTGTAGQLMRGLTDEDLLPTDGVCHGIGVRQGGGERSHIAFFNPGDGAANVHVSLFNGADGALEGKGNFTVPGHQLEQINNIVRMLNPDQDGSEKRLEVMVEMPVFGAVFRVNPWDDPVTSDFNCVR